jgi:hypothetical protein
MKRIVFFFFIALLFSTCSEVEFIKGVPIRQYADFVIDFSSEWNPSPNNWSSSRILGKENVYNEALPKNGYGDNTNAWSPYTRDDQREHIVVGFDTLQTVHTIEIYETWHPGAIDSVLLRKADTQEWIRVYSKPAPTTFITEARIFSIYIQETTFLVDAIRIALDSEIDAQKRDSNNEIITDGWNEIDAVAITGQRKK